jgi:alkanesulfonate monooxygenase SsuD/methylene tetrahydromethanopterin reductase-like flavin-dependent oxidoreductase (luciferase family)
MSLLAAVAGRAGEQGLTIATGIVVLPLRHPIALAQSFATLDTLNDGKLIIGVGDGSSRSDFDALGIPFRERGKMLEDGMVALRALLTNASVSHKGRITISMMSRCCHVVSRDRARPSGFPVGVRR